MHRMIRRKGCQWVYCGGSLGHFGGTAHCQGREIAVSHRDSTSALAVNLGGCITSMPAAAATAAEVANARRQCAVAATDKSARAVLRRDINYLLADVIIYCSRCRHFDRKRLLSKVECWRHFTAMWSADVLCFCWQSAAVTWLCSTVSVAAGIILAPVYWNASNPMWVLSLLSPVHTSNGVAATFDFVERTKFDNKLVGHCCRFWQQSQMLLRQSRTLLRYCCWSRKGLYVRWYACRLCTLCSLVMLSCCRVRSD